MFKINKKKAISFIAIVIIVIFFLMVCPIPSCSTYKAKENRMFRRHIHIAEYVEEFQKQNGRLPLNAHELSESLRNKTLISELFDETVEDISERVIADCTDMKITFKIEAVWEGKYNDDLVWAMTKSGHVIRFQKSLLHEKMKEPDVAKNILK